MKQALDKSDNLVMAAADSEPYARCPHCRAPVIRRQRRDGSGGVTYFWRHQDHTKINCPLNAVTNHTAAALSTQHASQSQ